MEQRPFEYTVKIYCEGFTEWYYFEWLRTIHLTSAEYRREINGTAKKWPKLQRYSMMLQIYVNCLLLQSRTFAPVKIITIIC